MTQTRVIIERDGPIAHVRLNRPNKHNAMDEAMLAAVIDAGRGLRRDRDLRAVVLSGAGPSFCAGLDVKSVLGDKRRALRLAAQLLKPWTNRFQHWGMVWRKLPVPVVACIHGNCFGAGMQLALAADFRIVRPDSRLSIMESKWGLVPDMTGMLTLPDLLPMDVAKELVFTARVLDADEAARLGLVTHVADDPQAQARMLVDECLQCSPDAIAAAKRLLHETYAERGEQALAAERHHQLGIIGRENQRIAARRNAEIARDGKASTPYRPRKRR